MFSGLHKRKSIQLLLGLLFGIVFGFLINKSMVVKYDVVISQLLLKDWSVFKVISTAIITGSIGVHILYDLKIIDLHIKSSSLLSIFIGGILFGIGFALLGYCPGILAGAIGNGHMDALLAGFPGIILGSGIFIYKYNYLDRKIMSKSLIVDKTFPQVLKINHWFVIIPMNIFLIAVLIIIENYK